MANQPGFKSSNSGIVLGDANIANCSLDGTSTTDAFGLSAGNTAQRPTNAHSGMIRWNTDLVEFEGYANGTWGPIANANINFSYPTSTAETLVSASIANASYIWGDPRRYGGDFTGNLDSTIPLQTAIYQSANGGAPVVMAGGTYNHNTLTIVSNTNIVAYGSTLNYQGSAQQITTPNTGVTMNVNILGATLNAGSTCTKILELYSTYDCDFDVRFIASNTSVIAIDLLVNTSGNTNPDGNYNNVFNDFYPFFDGTFGQGVRFTGIDSSHVCTLNNFYGFNSRNGFNAYGINFTAWSDTNHFIGETRIQLPAVSFANSIGVYYGSNANSSTNYSVYDNVIDQLAVDTFGTVTGDLRTGWIMGNVKGNYIGLYSNIPAAANGQFVVGAGCLGYYVNWRPAGTNSIEALTLNYLQNVADQSIVQYQGSNTIVSNVGGVYLANLVTIGGTTPANTGMGEGPPMFLGGQEGTPGSPTSNLQPLVTFTKYFSGNYNGVGSAYEGGAGWFSTYGEGGNNDIVGLTGFTQVNGGTPAAVAIHGYGVAANNTTAKGLWSGWFTTNDLNTSNANVGLVFGIEADIVLGADRAHLAGGVQAPPANAAYGVLVNNQSDTISNANGSAAFAVAREAAQGGHPHNTSRWYTGFWVMPEAIVPGITNEIFQLNGALTSGNAYSGIIGYGWFNNIIDLSSANCVNAAIIIPNGSANNGTINALDSNAANGSYPILYLDNAHPNILHVGNSMPGNIHLDANCNVFGILNVSSNITDMGYLSVRGVLPSVATINVAGGGITVGGQSLGNTQAVEIFVANSSVDCGWWEFIASNANALFFRTANDSYANINNWMKVTRGNSNVTGIVLGNPQDAPQVTVDGSLDVQSASPIVYQLCTTAAANGQIWESYSTSTGQYRCEARNDNQTNINQWMVVQRNTGTSNIANIQLGNINDKPNINTFGVILATGSPLTNTATRAETGLSIYLSANAQTGSNIAQTNVMSVTFNETGMYQVSGMIMLGTTGTANLLNIGANVSFLNSGSFNYNYLGLSYSGYCNTNVVVSTKLITNANGNVIISSNVANSTNNIDYLAITGVVNVSATGTAQTQIAAQNTVNGNLIVMSNSYLLFTKIG